jgi:hypothetical protein
MAFPVTSWMLSSSSPAPAAPPTAQLQIRAGTAQRVPVVSVVLGATPCLLLRRCTYRFGTHDFAAPHGCAGVVLGSLLLALMLATLTITIIRRASMRLHRQLAGMPSTLDQYTSAHHRYSVVNCLMSLCCARLDCTSCGTPYHHKMGQVQIWVCRPKQEHPAKHRQ